MKYPEHEMEWICPMPVWRFRLPDYIELNARISARVYELTQRDGMDRHQDICQQYLYPPGGYLNISPKSDIPFKNADKSEFKCKLMLPFLEFFENAVAKKVKGSIFEGGDYQLLLWSNINHPGDDLPIHAHPGSEIAGTYYVQIPEGECGECVIYNPHYFPALPGEPLAPAKTAPYEEKEGIKNKEGTMVFFRPLLMHDISKNNSQGDRITISFNVRFIDNAEHLDSMHELGENFGEYEDHIDDRLIRKNKSTLPNPKEF